jgi:hypothetical protein
VPYVHVCGCHARALGKDRGEQHLQCCACRLCSQQQPAAAAAAAVHATHAAWFSPRQVHHLELCIDAVVITHQVHAVVPSARSNMPFRKWRIRHYSALYCALLSLALSSPLSAQLLLTLLRCCCPCCPCCLFPLLQLATCCCRVQVLLALAVQVQVSTVVAAVWQVLALEISSVEARGPLRVRLLLLMPAPTPVALRVISVFRVELTLAVMAMQLGHPL